MLSEEMRTLRKFIVRNEFVAFLPEPSDFELVEEPMPALRSEEFLVRAEYISVDPYMRSFAKESPVPYEQFGFQVGKVVESRNKEFPVDSFVVSHSGWRDFAVLDGSPDRMFSVKPYRPQIGKLHLSLAIGALGMPGITAYLGLLEVLKPKNGEMVCVTSAAGAVGSIVGQIAKLKGCKVIGLAGSDQKVQFLKRELGFNHAFNYKTEQNIKQRLTTAAPKGIDCFFDNVGGSLAVVIMECMADRGRVAACGAISTYGQDASTARAKRPRASLPLEIEAFSFTQWDWPAQSGAVRQLREWVELGSVKAKETVRSGFTELPDALRSMLKGESIGKSVVKV